VLPIDENSSTLKVGELECRVKESAKALAARTNGVMESSAELKRKLAEIERRRLAKMEEGR
jgi:hypothetical protein